MASSTSDPTTLIEFNTTTNLPIKLNGTNYPAWYKQFRSLLVARNLEGYVTGDIPCPPITIKQDGADVSNPAYSYWVRQDQFLYLALLGSCDAEARTIMSSADTSAQAWRKLQQAYASRSRSRIMSLKERLTSITKGSSSISEYLRSIRNIGEELALIGHPIDDLDLVIHALNGLGPSFREFTASIRTRDCPIAFDELYDKLIDFEIFLQRDDRLVSPAPLTANFVNRNSSGSNRGRPHNSSKKSSSSSALVCQFCDKKGHTAKTCYKIHGYPPKQTPPSAHMAHKSEGNDLTWLLDSGASHHVTNDINNLSIKSDYPGQDTLTVANGKTLPITHMGSIKFPTSSRPLHLTNVLCVPSVTKNLISVSQLCQTNNVSIEFFPFHFEVKALDTRVMLLRGSNEDNVYKLPTTNHPSTAAYAATTTPSLDLWHHRLGHPAHPTLLHALSSNNISFSSSMNKCSDCLSNKSHKIPFSRSTIVSSHPLEFVYSDVWGPSRIQSIDGYSYYVIFIDHFSKYVWLYPIKLKSDVSTIFPTFKSLVENQFNTKIKNFYSDNGGEFIKLRAYFQSHGISHLTTPPHTPEHNGLSERKHRHLVETARCLIHHASLPITFWSYALQTAAYLINRLPTHTLKMKTPFSILFNREPNYSKLKVFGCLCFPWLTPYTQNKFETRSHPCVFVGYSNSQSAFLCFNLKSQKLFVSRHVQFVENIFPYSLSPHANPQITPPIHSQFQIPQQPLISQIPLQTAQFSTPPTNPTPPNQILTPPNPRPTQPIPNPNPTNIIPIPQNPHPTLTSTNTLSPSQTIPHIPQQTIPLIQSHNPHHPSLDLIPPNPNPTTTMQSHNPNTHTTEDLCTSSSSASHASPSVTSVLTPCHPMVTRGKAGIFKPKQLNLATKYPLTESLVPTCVSQAMKYHKWKDAMSEEFNALMHNGTWNLVPYQPHYNVIGNKWVFRLKRNPDGSIARYKARLVAKGFHQRPGIDYHETFSPVIKPQTIKLVLCIALSHGWPVSQMDVNNAFLHGSITEDVYMTQPPGFIHPSLPSHVCKLNKALYGLKQAPRAWYHALKDFLQSYGFKNSRSDTSLFIYNSNNVLAYFLVYVDDLLLTGNNEKFLRHFQSSLAEKFSLKDLGSPSHFLGVEIIPTSSGLFLSQHHYIRDILQLANMVDAKPVGTPMSTSCCLTPLPDAPTCDVTLFRRLIGSLHYLAITRPDLAYPVNKLAQYMQAPQEIHMQALKRILRYLKGSINHGLHLVKNSSLHLNAFCDSDWAGDTEDRRSTAAYIIYLGPNAISWSCKKQKTVARSSTEAEYRTIGSTTAEVLWLQELLKELGVSLSSKPTILSDNIGATYLCSNPIFHSRMKHLSIDYHFVRELVAKKELQVSHVPSSHQLADLLTKPLSGPRHSFLLSKIGVVTPPPSCGGV